MADTPAALSGIRILLVDDDPDSLEALSVLLKMNGATVRPCGDGLEARRALGTFRPDLVISDLSMPGEDGFELMAALRRLSPEEGGRTPAIAFSALQDPLARARALESGFQAFVPKPSEMTVLLRVVAAVVAGSSG